LPNHALARLSDYCISISDGDHQAPPKASSGVPFITISAINTGALRLDEASRFVPQSYYETLTPVRRAQAGDVLYSVTGSIGIPALVELHEKFVFQRHIALLRPAPEICDPRWLAYILASPAMSEQARAIATGTAQLTIPLTGLRELRVPAVSLAEQRRIVAKLDALTARLARARAELYRVPVLADHLRDAALTTIRTALESHPLASVSSLASTMFDGPFGSNLKSADYTSAGARVVRLENIGHLNFIEEKRTYISLDKYAGLTRHTLQPGDILFSSFVDREVRVCQFPDLISGPAINKADCFVVRPDMSKCDGAFLTYMLAAPATYEVMKGAVHGATRPRIGLTQLKNYEINLPPIAIQKKIVVELSATFARADRLEAEAARARALLDRLEAAILAKAFRGELVPQDPNDEPASVLLDRIRAQRAAAPKPKRGRRGKAEA